MPAVAATEAEIMEFLAEFRICCLVNTTCQYFVVKLPASNRLLPILVVKEVAKTVAKGIPTTIIAKIITRAVTGIRHFPRSTIFGRVDLPETVIYCLRPTTKVER